MNKIFTDNGWSDYLYWQNQDKKTLARCNKLLRDIDRKGMSKGIGKPEPLKGDLSGWWSRRIDDTNRLVYRIDNENLVVLSCRFHYSKHK